jgi:MFS family permease
VIALCGGAVRGYSGRVRIEAIRRGGQGTVFSVLWVVFFLHGMTPGFWVPALTNILSARGLGAWVPAAFMVPPLCAMISPLLGGALADQRMPADRLFVWSSVLCAVFLAAAFGSLQAGWHPLWFIFLLGCCSLFSGPGWGLLATIALTHLEHGERNFPLVRVGATVGWVAAGLLCGYALAMDDSLWAGQVAAVVRLVGGLLGFLLPHTPPMGSATSWRSRLGFDAFCLMKQRDTLVFFTVTMLFSIPLTALYMYGPEFLKVLGDAHPTGTMTVAQVLEVGAMVGMGWLMARFSVKAMLMWALGVSVLRFGMSAVAGVNGVIGWHIAGVALHGVCYTFYFITAQVFLDRRVEPGLKGQAQGLLVMVSSGLGPLVGSWLCGWLRIHCVTSDGRGWDVFWTVLGALIAVCFGVFALFYQDRKAAEPPTG